jgi:hypothetical protein
MKHAKDVVKRYHEAMGQDDWKAARALLKDDLEFQGPLDTFHRADDYITALQRLHPMIDNIDIKRVFGEGDEAVVLCDIHFKPPMPTMYVVEWYGVSGEKISRVQVVFDPRPMGSVPHK